MNDIIIRKIYLRLLEEGSDTIRPTHAIDMRDGLFTLLATPDYDPEDEIWEFLPGSIVRAKDFTTKNGLNIMVAYEQAFPDDGHKIIVTIYVHSFNKNRNSLRSTNAVDLRNGMYQLLPTHTYDPEDETWEFLPGSIVRVKPIKSDKGLDLLLADELVFPPQI